MTTWEEKKVDAYILTSSRLKPVSNEYLAIKTLLEEGNVLYWFLGKWETLELTKIFINLQFSYEYVRGGIQLRPNSKEDFYTKIMNYKAPEPNSYYEKRIPLGKEEKHDPDRLGWMDKKFK